MPRPHPTRFLGVAIVSLVAVFALTGCADKLTGGGWMLSADGVSKATFAVNYDVSDDDGDLIPDRPRVRGTYHDHGLEVRFRFDEVVPTTTGGEDNCFGTIATYESQDPRRRGGGQLVIAACDQGEPGAGEGDFLEIHVVDGPYVGYSNAGPILGGNFQAHETTVP